MALNLPQGYLFGSPGPQLTSLALCLPPLVPLQGSFGLAAPHPHTQAGELARWLSTWLRSKLLWSSC